MNFRFICLKILLVLLISGTFSSLSAQQLSFEIHPLKIPNHCLSISLEKRLNTNAFGFDIVGYNNVGAHKYTGIKYAPFYRIFLNKGLKSKFFIDVKWLAGYFNSDVSYERDGTSGPNFHTINRSYSCFGSCVSIGWKGLLGNHIFIRYSIGYQGIAMIVPKTINVNGKEYILGDSQWLPGETSWWCGGPGSFIDLKLAVGIQ